MSFEPDVAPNPLRQLSLEVLRRRTSMKWRAFPPDVLPLWVAEMDVPLADPVRRALTDAIALGDTGYAVAATYAEALDEFARARWGWSGVRPEHTAIVPDIMLGVVEVLKLITRPGDAVVVNTPVYPPFSAFVRHLDRRIVEAPLGADGRIDLAALVEAFGREVDGRRPAVYLLCSPHNPTGTVHTAAELAAVAALADAHRVRVVADEVHAPLVPAGATFVPYLSVAGTDDAFSLMSASKAWNLSGLKAALAICGPAAAGDLARIPEEVSHGPSHLGVIAHAAALREGGEWLDTLLVGLDANRRLLADLLALHLPEVGYRPPEGTYLAWLDCRRLAPMTGTGDPATATSRAPGHGVTAGGGDELGAPAVAPSGGVAGLFLDHGRVALSPGEPFGTGGAGHVRLNLATSPEIITEAVRRMASAVYEAPAATLGAG